MYFILVNHYRLNTIRWVGLDTCAQFIKCVGVQEIEYRISTKHIRKNLWNTIRS